MARAVSPFTIDAFEDDPPYRDEDGMRLCRSHLTKTFRGDLAATSTVEMLSARSASGGAGYVAIEVLSGTLEGRAGSFALLHAGTMEPGGDTWARWPIVPGSGTGELDGISGEARIDIAADGFHTLQLDYELP